VNHRERALELVRKMTPKEKAAQLYAVWVKIGEDGSLAFRDVHDGFIKDAMEDVREVLRDGIGEVTRPLGTRPADARGVVRGLNLLQKFLVERTRLGIPALAHEECLPGLMARGATLFPAAINLGSLWDEEAVREVASVIGREMHSVGARQGLAPVLDVCRDARWGRVEETFGEDPYLVGCMASAYVGGLQGKDRRVLATLKHYAGHSFSEGGRNHAPVHVGDRELMDVFLLPFEMAVTLANAGSVMPAYHDIDGEPSSSSRRLLTELLRERFGFDGIIVSDYEAVRLLFAHHGVARDEAEAAALALNAGMDIELPGFTCFRTGVLAALERGILDMATVDAAVTRVIMEKSRLGLFEHPYADEGAIVLNSEYHRTIASRAAARSMVLLKNDGVLPLRDEGTTALIGPLADDPLAVFCGYSFPVHLLAARMDDPGYRYAKTLREVLAERRKVGKLVHAQGCRILTERRKDAPVFPDEAEAARGQKQSYVSLDESGIEEAVRTARGADRIVAAVGDLSGLFLTGTVGEGSDASSLELPGIQQKLLEALLETGKPLVVVLLNGRPYNLGKVYDRAAAILEAWLPGQEGAEAIADVLYGRCNPGGRLPVSVPRSAGAMPYFYNHHLKAAGAPVQEKFGAVYPFGYGLGYTSFEYSGFRVAAAEIPVDGSIEVSCDVRNAGTREGEEVVQLYVRDVQARLVRPILELKGFRRVGFGGGQKKTVSFSLPVDMLCFSSDGRTRMVEPGAFEIMIGRSCEDIVFRATVTVTGRERTLERGWRMTCETRVEPA
jgi:beta-xylosidase